MTNQVLTAEQTREVANLVSEMCIVLAEQLFDGRPSNCLKLLDPYACTYSALRKIGLDKDSANRALRALEASHWEPYLCMVRAFADENYS